MAGFLTMAILTVCDDPSLRFWFAFPLVLMPAHSGLSWSTLFKKPTLLTSCCLPTLLRCLLFQWLPLRFPHQIVSLWRIEPWSPLSPVWFVNISPSLEVAYPFSLWYLLMSRSFSFCWDQFRTFFFFVAFCDSRALCLAQVMKVFF